MSIETEDFTGWHCEYIDGVRCKTVRYTGTLSYKPGTPISLQYVVDNDIDPSLLTWSTHSQWGIVNEH